MASALYEQIGPGYAHTRRADPRIARAIEQALGDAGDVVNIGAGTGSYEPSDRRVLAVEPAVEMRSGRPAGLAPCIAAGAERLPLPDASVDAAMAIYTDFHWRDRSQGVAEMVRVTRDRVLLLTVDRDAAARYWLTRDYFPDADEMFAPLAEVTRLFPTPPRVTTVDIPADCKDGFVHAFWKRPKELLDPRRRQAMAMFARLPPDRVEAGMRELRADLASGAWEERNAELAELRALDLGHRLVVWRRAA
jgi:hypothetical protein